MQGSRRTLFGSLGALLLPWVVSCFPSHGPTQLGYRIEFASEQVRRTAIAVRAEVARGNCSGERIFSTDITPEGDATSPDALPPGTYAFVARARDASCYWVAGGCTVVELPRSGDVVVVLDALAQAERDPTCRPAPPEVEPERDGGSDAEPEQAVDAGALADDAGASTPLPTEDGGVALPSLRLAPGDTFQLGTDASGGRSCPDGVAAQVVALTARRATLRTPVSEDCFAEGDEALLIDLQGAPGQSANVGAFELVRVATSTATSVTFTAPHVRSYGARAGSDDGLGADDGEQRVALVRVPHYAEVSVPEGAVLTTSPWDGATGGVLALRSDGTVRIDGEVLGSGLGFRGGSPRAVAGASGQQGESIQGPGDVATGENAGGGGGGTGDLGAAAGSCIKNGVGGGGGGHVTAGAGGSALCGGLGGAPFHGDADDRLFLGAGGGAGGTDDDLTENPSGGAGGRGGGVVLVLSPRVVGRGRISVEGSAGEGTPAGASCSGGSASLSCWDYAGPGGGGSGGSLLVRGTADVAPALSAAGGAGGDGLDVRAGDGGRGGAGFVLATDDP